MLHGCFDGRLGAISTCCVASNSAFPAVCCTNAANLADASVLNPTPVSVQAAAKAELQADVGLPVDPTAPVFGFIGRLEEQKGVDILLAALPQIVAQNKKAQVRAQGGGCAACMLLARGPGVE